jgi:Glycosyltransferase family 87
MTLLILLFSLYIKFLTLALVVACLLRAPVKAYQIRWVAAGAAALLLLDLYVVLVTELALDYHIFWRAGRDFWEGGDPYGPAHFVLHPPTALPVFAVFALAPYRLSLTFWTVLNILLGLALPILANRTLASQEASSDSRSGAAPAFRELPPLVLAALTLVLVVSDAFRYGLFAGQLSVVTSVALLAALDRQGRGRPVAAGLWLSLATLKTSTVLPFLLLFLRRRDVRTWVALTVTGLVLFLLGGSPELLPKRLSLTRQRIESLSGPGQVNDYSFQGTQYATMIGFDHALYRLGLRHRTIIRNLQLLAVLLLGAAVAVQVVAARLPRPALCSLVALYSVLFFYHRTYDTVILVLPLVYSAGRARSAEGRSRCLFSASCLWIILVLFANATLLKSLTESSLNWGLWGRLVQATVTAYPTWMILVAMACIYSAESRGLRRIGVQ